MSGGSRGVQGGAEVLGAQPFGARCGPPPNFKVGGERKGGGYQIIVGAKKRPHT